MFFKNGPICPGKKKNAAGQGEQNPVTMLIVRACIWCTMPWYGLQQAGTLRVGNRLLVWITSGWHTPCR